MAEKNLCPVPPKRSKHTHDEPTTVEVANLAVLKSKEMCNATSGFESKLYNEQVPIQAHQICLRALSLVFEHMLQTSRKDERTKYELTDVKAGAFQFLLEFIHGDKLDVSVAEALDVLYLADIYGAGPLIKKCKDSLQLGATAEPLLQFIL